MHIFIFKA